MQSSTSDVEILTELSETEGVSDDDDDDDNDDDDYYYFREVPDEPVKCLDKNELLQVIETLQRFSLFLGKGDTI